MEKKNQQMYPGDIIYDLRDGKAFFGVVRNMEGTLVADWHPSGQSELLGVKTYKVYDRALEPGFVVRKYGKSCYGICWNTSSKLCLRILSTDFVIPDVDSSTSGIDNLPHELRVGKLVIFNGWVGVVMDVRFEITVRSDDGCACTISQDDYVNLVDIHEIIADRGAFKKVPFYIGQKVRGMAWTDSDLEDTHTDAQVESYKIVSVQVRWGFNLNTDEETRPEEILKGKDLESIVNVVPMTKGLQRHCVNSYSRFTVRSKDGLMDILDWREKMHEMLNPSVYSVVNSIEDPKHEEGPKTSKPSLKKKISLMQQKRLEEESNTDSGSTATSQWTFKPATGCIPYNSEVPAETYLVTTRTEILWQDGTVDHNVLSIELKPVTRPKSILFPYDFVFKRSEGFKNTVYGVVRYIKNNLATVQWSVCKLDTNGRPVIEVNQEEILEPHTLQQHPRFTFRHGDFVKIVDPPGSEDLLQRAGVIRKIKMTGSLEVELLNQQVSTFLPVQVNSIDQSLLKVNLAPRDSSSQFKI